MPTHALLYSLEHQSVPSAVTLVLSSGRTSGARRPNAERPLVLAGCATSRLSPGDSRMVSGAFPCPPVIFARFQMFCISIGRTPPPPSAPRRLPLRHKWNLDLTSSRLSLLLPVVNFTLLFCIISMYMPQVFFPSRHPDLYTQTRRPCSAVPISQNT